MPEQVDHRITPALHPATLTAIEGYTEETAPFIADAISVMNDAYRTLGKLHDAAALARSNGAWTEEQAVLYVSKEAEKQQQRLNGRFDGVMSSLRKGIDFCEGELTQPLKERAGLGNLNVEVRSHAKGLNATKRAELINEAFERGDDDTLQAMLGAQHFLTGMSSEEHAHYLRRYHEKRNPSLVARLSVMRAALTKFDTDGGKLFVEIDKARGANTQKANAIALANERAIEALKIEPA